MKSIAATLLLIMAAPSYAQFSRGINLAGAEFGQNNLPGTLGRDYTFNNETTYQYFSAKNLNLIRVMLRWERLQPALRGPLDSAYLSGVKNNVAWAKAHGASVILDIHNYGRYKILENGVLNEYTLDNTYAGAVRVSGADLADLWTRLAAEFRDETAVYAYDLMNEPHDMGSANWKTISQNVLNAIRAAGDSKLVLVPGDAWSSAEQWPIVHGPNAWITDPAGNFAYEAHEYFDRDNSGTYALTYDQELALNPQLASIGPQRLGRFVTWLKNNNVRGYLGEYGIPNTDARWKTVLDNFLTALDGAGLNGTYWAAGEWWGDYPLSVQPLDNFQTDRPQLGILAAHLAPGSFTTVSAASAGGFVFAPDSLVTGYARGLPDPVEVMLADAAGIETIAPVLFSNASQVNYLVPAGLPLERFRIEVRSAGGVVARGGIELRPIAPALFSANGDGRGVAAAQVLRVRQDGSFSYEPVVQFDAAQNRYVSLPVDFGDASDRLFLILYGTGFRAAGTTTLAIGNTPLAVLYSGKQPEFAGLDQVNAELPRTLAGAGELGIVFTAGGKRANAVTLAFQ